MAVALNKMAAGWMSFPESQSEYSVCGMQIARELGLCVAIY